MNHDFVAQIKKKKNSYLIHPKSYPKFGINKFYIILPGKLILFKQI